jgi:hypothetical protein
MTKNKWLQNGAVYLKNSAGEYPTSVAQSNGHLDCKVKLLAATLVERFSNLVRTGLRSHSVS